MKKYIMAVTMLFLMACPAWAAMDWKLLMEHGGVRTYMREVPGSPIKEFKGICILDAKMEVIAAVLRDMPSFVEWMPQCKQSKVIEQQDFFTLVFYNEFSMPWPLNNRDSVLKGTAVIDKDTGRAHVNFWAVEDPRAPERKGIIRMKHLKGTFSFEYLGRSNTRLAISYQVDPGGYIPPTLSNLAVRHLPYLLMRKLKKRVKEPEYIKRAETSEEKKMLVELMADKQLIKNAMRNRLTEYFQNPEMVNRIVSDPAFMELALKDGLTMDDINKKTSDIFRASLKCEDPHKYIKNQKIADRIQKDPELTEWLLRDKLSKEMIFDGAGTFEQVLEERIKAYKGK